MANVAYMKDLAHESGWKIGSMPMTYLGLSQVSVSSLSELWDGVEEIFQIKDAKEKQHFKRWEAYLDQQVLYLVLMVLLENMLQNEKGRRVMRKIK